ncbi:MAG: methyl-accepting chemotaxis protein [Sterolibacterium sp.]
MKTNLPVTQIEQPFPKGKYIVSKTDLKGITTYGNDTFFEISGFSPEELIGKNHNIVRHPDMPPSAFAWLWNTIQDGRPWRGVVKNRSKNGDYYWVEALVVPVRKNNQTTGYMSVRTEPSRAQIAAAEPLYKSLKQSGASIPEPSAWQRISLRGKLTGLAIGMVLLQCLGVLVGLFHDKLDISTGVASGLLQVLGVLAIVAGVSLIAIQRKALTSLNKITERLDHISQGDLTDEIPIQGLDELGKLNDGVITMQTHLKVMMAEIAEMAGAVGDNAKELSHEMDGVYQQSEQQTTSVMSIATTMEEVSASVRQVADSAQAAAAAVSESGEGLRQVSAQMQQSREASHAVVSTVSEASATMLNLFQSIQQIGTITQGIHEIAEQTNLLALNAAIEAARAGEMGRGFAVVADEVRKLAERSRVQTDEIGKTVQAIQMATQVAVGSMDAAGDQVKKTDAQMDQTEEGLLKSAEQGEHISDMARHIASASEEQSRASEEVTHNTSKIASAIESNLAIIAEARASAGKLDGTAVKLHELIQYFHYVKR